MMEEARTFNALRNWDEMLSTLEEQKDSDVVETGGSPSYKCLKMVNTVVHSDSIVPGTVVGMERDRDGRRHSL